MTSYLKDLLWNWISWFKHKPPDTPKHAQIIINNRCNARCKHCDIWKVDPRLSISEELTTEQWIKVVDELAELKVATCSISGGEPLLRKDIFEIARKLTENNIWVNITTNGSLLTQNIGKKLIIAGVNSLTISIDGTQPIHDTLRGLNFNKIMRSIEQLQSLKQTENSMTPTIHIASTVMNCNAQSILELNDYLRDKYPEVGHSFDSLYSIGQSFFPEIGSERFFAGTLDIVAEKPTTETFNRFLLGVRARPYLRYLRKYLELMRKYCFGEINYPSILHPCLAGLFNIVITHKGEVVPCCSWSNTGSVGNVKNGSLKDLWFSKQFYERRKQIFKGECPGCWVSTYARTSSEIWLGTIVSKLWNKYKRIFRFRMVEGK